MSYQEREILEAEFGKLAIHIEAEIKQTDTIFENV
jgi:hypothetical protein